MVRKLKHHEQKLLRKVNLITYAHDPSHRSSQICRRYCIQDPADYAKYNRLCGSLRQLAHLISQLPVSSSSTSASARTKYSTLLLAKLHAMGLVPAPAPTTPLSAVAKLSVSRFARRRLAVVMARTGMVENLQAGVKFVEQGHVRVGTDVVTDPAFLVTRGMEDWIRWVDGKIKDRVVGWKGLKDDF